MKNKSLCLLAALGGSSLTLLAAPLRQPLTVHAQPAAEAPVIARLAVGAEAPTPALAATAPEGWRAVTLPGPHEIYVDNAHIGKRLDVTVGSPMRTEPRDSGPVLALAGPDDETEITGLRGKWTQLRLTTPVVGYVQDNAGSTAATAAAPVPAPATSAPVNTPVSDRTARPAPAPAHGGVGRPVARSADDREMASLPRLFEGTFVSTRAPFRPRRPFDFALNGAGGARIAYVDVSKLMLTDQIENYLDRTVVVYGAARPLPDSNDIVIQVESLQLR